MSKLFNMFQAVTKEEWLAKVTKDLKGKPIEGLNWSFEGEEMTPFYHADDVHEPTQPITNSSASNAWQTGAYIHVDKTDYKAANAMALVDLQRGASALCFSLEETPDLNELKVLTNNWKRISDNFQKVIAAKAQNPSEVACQFICNGVIFDEAKDFEDYKTFKSILPKGSLLNISNHSTTFDTISEELSALIAKGNAVLAKLNAAGFDLNECYQDIAFHISVNDQYFESLAKVRSLKALWGAVLQAWNADWDRTCKVTIHASLADQVEIYIHPSDGGNGTSFSRRIALNVQHLLQQESYLDRVVDPAAGSYFIEALTHKLCEGAWASFQQKH